MSEPDRESIDGIWQMIRAEFAGEVAHELVTTNTVMELKEGTYAVRFDGEVADWGSFELGGTSEAKTIVLRGIAGPNAGRTIPCIYQRVGDRLRVRYGINGIAPKEFRTAPGTNHYLATYQRKPCAQTPVSSR